MSRPHSRPPLQAPSRPLSRSPSGTPVIGIAGWKNSGKTTLAVRLIAELVGRGYRVASVKHAHHAFQIDDGDTDSARHRRAGAAQVAIVSSRRMAIVSELAGATEPDLAAVLASLGPADIYIVEGYKSAAITKIEVRSTAATVGPALSPDDEHVIAIAADPPPAAATVPVFARDDIAALADLLVAAGGLRVPSRRAGEQA